MLSCIRLLSDLHRDALFHIAEGFECIVIKVAPVYERFEVMSRRCPDFDVSGHRARFDQGVALPLPSMSFVVALHALKAERKRARFTERPQAVYPHEIRNPSAVLAPMT
jgi:hypothetical protein